MPDDTLLASGSRDRTVRLWNVKTGEALHVLKQHTQDVMSVKFSPDGGTLASGSYDGTVCLWQMPDGKLLHTLRGHKERVHGVAFSPDGKHLASVGEHTLQIWDLGTADAITISSFQGTVETPLGTLREQLSSVAYSPDGSKVAVGSTAGRVYLLSTKTGELIRELRAGGASVAK